MATENVTTKFKVDISDLKKNINDANNQIKLANAQFKNATVGMDDWSKSADGLSAKIKAQQTIIEAEKTKLAALKDELARVNKAQEDSEKAVDELNKQYQEAVKQFGENSKEAQNYAKQLEAAEKAQQRNADTADKLRIQIVNQDTAVKEAESALDGYENSLNNLDSSTENAEKSAQGLNNTLDENSKEFKAASDGGVEAFAVALGDLASKVIQKAIDKLVELGGKVKEAYLEFDDGRDAVLKATGATGDAADALTKSYANVAKNISGDFADIGSTLGEVNTRFGYSGEALEDTTEKFLKFADITGTDAVGAVQKVSRAMQNAGIPLENYEELLDQLAVVGQATGISVDKVAESLTKNGSTMRELGFNTAETIAMLGQFEIAGVNSETAVAGLKTAVKEWSKEGKNANDEFHKTVEAVMSAPDDIEAAKRAVEAFGSKAGTELADAMRTGRFAYDELLATIGDGKGTVETTYDATQNAVDRANLAMQNMRVTVAEIAQNFVSKYEPQIIGAITKITDLIQEYAPKLEAGLEWLENHLPEIEAGILGVGAAFVTWKVASLIFTITKAVQGMTLAEAALAVVQELLNKTMMANPLGLIISLVAGLVTAFVVLWNKSEKFRNFWIGLWDKIKTTCEPVVKSLAEWFKNAWVTIQAIWAGASEWFKQTFEKIKNSFALNFIIEVFKSAWEYISTVAENIKLVFSALKAVFSGDFEGAWTAIKKIVSNWSKYFKKNVWGNIKKVFEPVTKFFKQKFDSAWTAIKNTWSAVASWFNDKVFKPIMSYFQPVIDFFTTGFKIISELADGCVKAIKAVWSKVSDWFKANVGDPLKSNFEKTWSTISDSAKSAWNIIKTAWTVVAGWFKSAVIDPLKKFFTDMWSGITLAGELVINGIKSTWGSISGWFSENVVSPVGNFFTGMWDKVKSGASDAWNGIKSAFGSIADWFEDKFSKAWTAVKNVFSTGGEIFGGIVDGIESAFKKVVNAIIRGINKVVAIPFNAINNTLDKLRNAEIAGVKPFEKLITRFNVPVIPELAKGGVLKRGQIGLLEGNGAEAVIPLEKNTGALRLIAGLLSQDVGYYLKDIIRQSKPQITNNYYFTQTNNSPKALSRWDIYRQTKNILNYSKGV